jgi:hypothetical protein
LCELKLLLVEGVAIRLSTRATLDSRPPIEFTHARHCMPTLRTMMCKAYPSCAFDGRKRQTNTRCGSKRARRLGRGKHSDPRTMDLVWETGCGLRECVVRLRNPWQPAPLNKIKLKACMSDIPTCMEKMCTCAGEVPMAGSQKVPAMRNTRLLWNQLANARF